MLGELPRIRELLKGDVQAAYDGDPAAKSYEEIVMSYPCIIAIATYRIAHELHVRQVPLIPRIMSECAHMRTGIDIHPGAAIGGHFFIDHGTGVVIGETSIIGKNVKIYQGTTLGALSFRRDDRGRIIKGGKRHPTIEDDVTIYAEATILGDVMIGKGAVIGGNTWVKESVPPGMTVSSPGPDLVYRKQKTVKGKKGLSPGGYGGYVGSEAARRDPGTEGQTPGRHPGAQLSVARRPGRGGFLRRFSGPEHPGVEDGRRDDRLLRRPVHGRDRQGACVPTRWSCFRSVGRAARWRI